MTAQLIIVATMAAFVWAGLSAKAKNPQSVNGFSTSRDNLSGFITAAGISMTFVGGAALINMASMGYTFGWYTLFDPAAMTLGMLLSTVLISKYRADRGITIANLLSSDHKPLALYIGIITSVVFLLITAAQFVAFSKLLSPYFPGVHPILVMLVPSVVITLYVLRGGFLAVTRTDVLQMVFVATFLLLPIAYFLTFKRQVAVNSANTFQQMPSQLAILLCIPILFIPVSQDINIRAKSAKDDKAARIGFIGGAVFYSSVVIACSYMGISLARHGVQLEDPEAAFPTFFKHFFPACGTFAILAGMAAIWSTLDTYLVNTITSVAEDVFKRSKYGQQLQERRLIVLSALIVFTLAMLIGVYFFQVLALVLTALLIYISVLVPIAIARQLNISDKYILSVSLVTLSGIIACELSRAAITPKAVIYPAVGTCLMIAGKLLGRAKPTV